MKTEMRPSHMRDAITMKCWDCKGFDYDQREILKYPQKKIEECPISSCFLYPVRPRIEDE